MPRLRGRSAAVISRHSAESVRSYLAAQGLAEQIHDLIAPASYPPGHLQTVGHLIEDTLDALGAKGAECALITASATGLETAHNAGTHSIGYATTRAASQQLTDAGAGCITPSLADLTLRLRARSEHGPSTATAELSRI